MYSRKSWVSKQCLFCIANHVVNIVNCIWNISTILIEIGNRHEYDAAIYIGSI